MIFRTRAARRRCTLSSYLTLVFLALGTVPAKADTTSVALYGWVIDAESKAPVRNFTISIEQPPAEVEAPRQALSLVPARAFESRDGSFSVRAAARPSWLVIASAPGYIPAAARVGPSGAANITLSMTRGVEVSGVVSDEAGRPPPGVAIGAEIIVPPPAVRVTVEATTDAQGKYAIAFPPGDQRLLFSFPGFVTEERSVRVDPATPPFVAVTMRPAFRLEVRVVDDLGSAVPGADFRLTSLQPTGQTSDTRHGTADHQGRSHDAGTQARAIHARGRECLPRPVTAAKSPCPRQNGFEWSWLAAPLCAASCEGVPRRSLAPRSCTSATRLGQRSTSKRSSA